MRQITRPGWFGGLKVSIGLVAVLLCGRPLDAQEPARNFLWSVTSKGGASVYLLGSVHVLTRAFYPLSPVIDDAFAQSKVLVEEVDLDEMTNPATMMSLVGKAMLPDGQTLDQLVSKETYAALRSRAESDGIPMALLQRMKPWMAAVTLTAAELTKAGFEAEMGIDRHFFDRARTAGMPRRALETAAYQFDRLDGLSGPLQEASLKAMLADIDTQASSMEKMATAWRSGDTRTLESLLLDAFRGSPEIYDRLLLERNRNWVPHIEGCLTRDERCFIVVGAAHLVGPDSVIALLEKAGTRSDSGSCC